MDYQNYISQRQVFIVGLLAIFCGVYQDAPRAEEPEKTVTVSGSASGTKTENGKVIQSTGSAVTSGGKTATGSGETIVSRGEKGVLWNGKRKIVTGNGHAVSIAGEGSTEKAGKTTKYQANRSGTSANGTELWKSTASGAITHTGSGEATYDVDKSVETKNGETYTVDKNGTVTKTDSGVDWSGTNTTTGPKGNSRSATVEGTATRTGQGVTFSEKRRRSPLTTNASSQELKKQLAKTKNAQQGTRSSKPKRSTRARGGRGR